MKFDILLFRTSWFELDMMINSFFCRLIPVVFSFALAACTGTLQEQLLSSAADGQYGLEKLPIANPAPSLSTDIIYNVLVGEIALQRQDLSLAYTHQLKSADLAQDAVAAERAVRIALHQKDQAGALKATESWIRLAPESVDARQIAVMLYMQKGDADIALNHLKQVVKLHGGGSQDGFIQAVVAVASGENNDLALQLMQSLSMDYRSSADASYAVALTAVMAKRFDVAESEVRKAIKVDPKMENAYVLLSRIYMERKDSDGAMKVMRQALKKLPDSKSLHSGYARLLIDLDKPRLAYQQFQQLSKLDPDDDKIIFSLGVLALQTKKFKQAAGHFNALLQDKTRVDDASFYMGRIADEQERPKEAMDWYGKVKGGKFMFAAQLRMVGLVAEHESLEKARVMLAGMRVRMPDRSVDLYIMEGDLLRKFSSQEKVIELFDAALKDHPDDLDLLYARALSASALGRMDILERDINLILKKKPDHADALNALGYTLADQTDRYQEAMDYIKKALALKPDSPAILDSMGWIQYRLGNHVEALAYLRRAFDMAQDVEIAAHLGELLWVTGKKQEAQKIMRGALEKNPDNKYLLKTIKRLGI